MKEAIQSNRVCVPMTLIEHEDGAREWVDAARFADGVPADIQPIAIEFRDADTGEVHARFEPKRQAARKPKQLSDLGFAVGDVVEDADGVICEVIGVESQGNGRTPAVVVKEEDGTVRRLMPSTLTKVEATTSAAPVSFEPGTRVRHTSQGVEGVVTGQKNEGGNRGYTIEVHEDNGAVHHYRPSQLTAVTLPPPPSF